MKNILSYKNKNRTRSILLLLILMLSLALPLTLCNPFTVITSYATNGDDNDDGDDDDNSGSTSTSGSGTSNTGKMNASNPYEGKNGSFSAGTSTEPSLSYSESAGADAANSLLFILTDSTFGLLTVIQFGGLAVLVLGFARLVLAFRDDNPNEKSQGTMLIMGGILLIIIPTLMSNIMDQTNMGVDFSSLSGSL